MTETKSPKMARRPESKTEKVRPQTQGGQTAVPRLDAQKVQGGLSDQRTAPSRRPLFGT